MKNLWATKLMKNLLLNVSTLSYLLINNWVFVRLLRWMHSSQRTMARQFRHSFAHKNVIWRFATRVWDTPTVQKKYPKRRWFNGTKFFYWIGLLPKKVGKPCFVTNCIRMMGLIQSKKKHLNCLRPFVYFVTRNSRNIYFASWSSCIKECMEKNHWSQCKFWKCSNNWIRRWWLII